MKSLYIFTLLYISIATFSQTASDSTSMTLAKTTSMVVHDIDSIQMERIEEIENSLSAFYTYNRNYHSLMYVSLGLSVASILLVTTQNDSSKAGFIGIAGGTIGFIGTVIYLDSYKFLNFKSKLKKKNSQRAINY